MKTRWLRTGPLAACAALCCKKPQASPVLPAGSLPSPDRAVLAVQAAREGFARCLASLGGCSGPRYAARPCCYTHSGADDTNALTSLTTSKNFSLPILMPKRTSSAQLSLKSASRADTISVAGFQPFCRTHAGGRLRQPGVNAPPVFCLYSHKALSQTLKNDEHRSREKKSIDRPPAHAHTVAG